MRKKSRIEENPGSETGNNTGVELSIEKDSTKGLREGMRCRVTSSLGKGFGKGRKERGQFHKETEPRSGGTKGQSLFRRLLTDT